MISIEEIERTISELESRDTSFANCEKLANLYVVRDHLKEYQQSTDTISAFGSSEFLQAVKGKDSLKLLEIMDDLMQTLSVMYPKVYESVLREIDNI